MSSLTKEQQDWLAAHPDFGPVGPPRDVKFSEWGSLYPDGTYERMDNSPRGTTIRLPALGVARLAEPQP
jgi:hypothetical protein